MASTKVESSQAEQAVDTPEFKTPVDVSDPTIRVTGMDAMFTNVLGSQHFTIFRKWFSDDQGMMVQRIASHVKLGLYELVRVQISGHYCVVICKCTTELEQWPDEALIG